MRHVTAATRNQGDQSTGIPTKLFQSAPVAHPGSRCRDVGAGGPTNQDAVPGALVGAVRGRAVAGRRVRPFSVTRRAPLRFLTVALIAIFFAAAFASSAFAAETHPYTGISFGPDGTAASSFVNLQGVAVDPASGDVYAFDAGNGGRIYKFDESGAPVDFSASGNNSIEAVGGAGGGENQIAVAPPGAAGGTAGDIYVVSYSASTAVSVYAPSGAKLGEFAPPNACGIAVDPTGRVFVGIYPGEVREYIPSADPVTDADESPTKSSGVVSGICNVAADGLGNVYAAGYIGGPVQKLEGLGDESPTEVDPTGNTLAVDPSSDALYVDRRSEFAQYTPSGAFVGFSGAGQLQGSQGIAANGSTDFVYAANGSSQKVDVFGSAVGVKPMIEAQWAETVGSSEATLKAQINPEGLPTTFHFEYGPDSSYGTRTVEREVGADETGRTVTVRLQGLSPGTTYHYRFVATNSYGVTEGPDKTFSTPTPAASDASCPNQVFRQYSSADLPDCRAYEMVSPIDKNGGNVVSLLSTFNYTTALDQSSVDGNKLTYSSYASFTGARAAPYVSQYMATRNPQTGWATEAISPEQNPGKVGGVTFTASFEIEKSYRDFLPDLSSGWFKYFGEKPLAQDAAPGLNFVRRYSDGTLDPLIQVEREKLANFEAYGDGFEFQGASTDGSAEMFTTRGALTADSTEESQLYLRKDKSLHLVCVLPDGVASTNRCSAGTPEVGPFDSSVSGAISADGSHVYWSDETLDFSTFSRPGVLYLRLNPAEPQSAMSEGECTEPQKACTVPVSDLVPNSGHVWFWTASTDGRRALFAVNPPSGGTGKVTGEELYEYDADTGQATFIASGLEGVLGASNDGTYVYFASTEALAPGAAAGKPNLYLRHAGAISLVAVLSTADVSSQALNDIASPSNIEVARVYRVSKVSGDGRELVFVSDQPLTGYDNVDARSGHPDREVFLFKAGTSGPVCVSCNPTGARPSGKLVYGLGESKRGEPEPGQPGGIWTAATTAGWNSSFNPLRSISEDGSRVVFDSWDALVPRDGNGAEDVYEWTAEGSRGCEAGSAAFHSVNAGCISLISDGESATGTEMVDMSADARDIFIRTSSSLVPQDPGLVDIYDARSGGGFASPPALPPSCEGEACQGPSSAPADPTPSSQTYDGPGNLKKKKAPRKHRQGHKKHRKPAHRTRQRHPHHQRRSGAHGRRAVVPSTSGRPVEQGGTVR